MNNKLVLIIILLLTVVIWVILFKISVNNIEKFDIPDFVMDRITKNQILYPPIDNYTINTLTKTNDLNNYVINFPNIKINICENFSIPSNDPKTNTINNGYSLYYIYSSFIKINNSSLISNLFKPNNNVPILLDNSKISTFLLNDNTTVSGNYIIFQYPMSIIQFTKISININSNDNLSSYVSLYQGDQMLNSFTPITNITFNQTNNILTGVITDAPIVLNTLLILFNNNNIKKINLNNINIYAIPRGIDVINDNTTSDNDANFQGYNIPLITGAYIDTYDASQYTPTMSIEDRFKNLISIKPPWGMYNCATININNTNKLKDVFNRECRYATIINKYDIISNETTYYNNQPVNLQYLKGDQNTQIIFPEGSLPTNYTICIISRYTSSDNSKCNRILTSTDASNPDWLLGHFNNYIKVMYNKTTSLDDKGIDNGNGNGYASPFETAGNTEWLVSCCKSDATVVQNSILFNGIPSAKQQCDIVKNPLASLSINGSNKGQKSEFGLAYLIIWDRILADQELAIASDMLINYITTNADFKLNISIYTKDGSTPERAGNSAREIKLNTCTNEDKPYWINIPFKDDKGNITYVPKLIYCIMNSVCQGGGWMLAIKGAKNSGTFAYDSAHWTTNTTLNTSSVDMSDTDAKFDVYNTYKFSECLAIFPSQDVAGLQRYPNNPEYGWTWHLSTSFPELRTLLDFFSGGYQDYIFGTNGRIDSVNTANKHIFNVGMSGFENYVVKTSYHPRAWSQQNTYKAYGFNVVPYNWNHKARWGATFNENGDGLPTSNDVSGGIGLSNRAWNAGDIIGCCQSSTGTNSRMGFKWFIR